jgi:hypothetical protein
MGYDFDFFWRAARAIFEGHSPYAVEGFFSPLPFAWAMLPFGLLPFQAAFSAWTVLSVVGLVVLTKRNALKAMLFLPVVFGLWVGQVDLVILWGGLRGGWLGLALTTLKPQLAIWLIPYTFGQWWRAGERKKILYTMLTVLVLYGVPTVVWPAWWSAWLANSPSIFVYAEHASSLFGAAALIALPVEVSFLGVVAIAAISLFWLKPFSEARYWPYAAIFNPVSNIYSLCLLVRNIDWMAVAASWALLPLALWLHTGLPWALVPACLLLREYRKRDEQSPSTLRTSRTLEGQPQ